MLHTYNTFCVTQYTMYLEFGQHREFFLLTVCFGKVNLVETNDYWPKKKKARAQCYCAEFSQTSGLAKPHVVDLMRGVELFVMGSSKGLETSSIFNTEMVFVSLLLQIMRHFRLHVYIFFWISTQGVWCSWCVAGKSPTWSLQVCM